MGKQNREQWEERFKETAEMLPGVICEMDNKFRVTYANKFAFESLKYSESDLEKGLYLSDLMYPDDTSRGAGNIAKLMEGHDIGPQEYRLVHKDGTVKDYQINSAARYENGKIIGIRTCIFDISERKEAAKKLRQSEERFRRIYSESPIGIALFTTEGVLMDANPAFSRLFRISQKESGFEFPPLFEYVSLDKDTLKKLRQGMVVQYASDIPIPNPEAPDEIRHLEWYFIPFMSVDANRPMYLTQVLDITEKKRAADAQLQAAEEAAETANRLVENLRQEVRRSFTVADMVSRSPKMQRIFDILPQVAGTPATVLVTGESGTGKELIARALHKMSPRNNKAFIAINCSALPDNLLESELFGYKAGAFTDAKKDKPGKFAQAEGGVIFLDEIGDISPAMQVKLLRILQEKVYEPLGGTQSIKSDVRVVAATNKNLEELVNKGSFREDLFYRLNILQIKLPPLRDRRADIPLLCEHFIIQFNKRYGKNVAGISKPALDRLLVHDFNGNVRELENIIEHAFVFCNDSEIALSHLPEAFQETDIDKTSRQVAAFGSLEELESAYLQAVIKQCGGSKRQAAEKLGIHKSTLFRKLKRLGIS